MARYAEALKNMVKSNTSLKPVLKAINNSRCRAWDLVRGVDTCGEIPLAVLAFVSKNKTPDLEYQSHHPAVIRSGLMALDIRHEDYTFIDIGCGKGRVLLIASELPFCKIIGLEFAPSLAETARQNLRHYRGLQRCKDIEVITGDATEYEFPSGSQVLYFYSPFSPTVLDRVVRRVEDSFQRSPRELLVMFSDARPRLRLAAGIRAFAAVGLHGHFPPSSARIGSGCIAGRTPARPPIRDNEFVNWRNIAITFVAQRSSSSRFSARFSSIRSAMPQ